MIKKIICALLLVCMSVSLCGCTGKKEASDIEAIKKAGVIRVGMECDYAPFNWMVTEPTATSKPIQSGGYADGYDIYFSTMVADALGVDVEVVKLEWSGLTLALEAGTIDVIIAGMSPTEERKVTVDFTAPYYTGEKVVIMRGDSSYIGAKTLDDLAGASITAQLNNVFYKELIDQIPGVVKAQAYENTPLMIVAVETGVVDGFIDDIDVAKAVVAANPALSYVRFGEGKGFVLDESETTNAVGCRKGSDLVDFINDLLANVSTEQRDALMDKARAEQPLTVD